MAYYYKVSDVETADAPTLEGIEVYEEKGGDCSGPSITYDFSKHVLIELLDNVTPEAKLWHELGLTHYENIVHKRMIVDPHRINCRRAVVVCSDADEAKELAHRLSQAKIMKRSICAVVIQELLSDICLFEKQIIQYGDKRSQHQLVYVTELARRREPSGLAQYLREKFSPFGTILSVLVSEDKDGYAYPEGVIKFAHLSEAFAAELAYDQCAVALERLSVTTHHNILLSQCDLRARLREAYSRQASEFSFNVSPESKIKDKPVKDSDSDQAKILTRSNGKHYVEGTEKNNESILSKSSSAMNDNGFPSDSAELADILQKPCEPSNLIDCLQGIAQCSESLISRRASVDSLAETEPGSLEQLALSSSPNNIITSINRTWSSRIMGWITDLPNIDPSSQVGANTNYGIGTESIVPVLESSVSSVKNKKIGCNQQSKSISPSDVLSNANSFVTCNNDDINSSFPSLPASPNEVSDSNNTTVVEDKTLSHSSIECNLSETSYEETSYANHSSVCKSITNKSDDSSMSLKRKNPSVMSQKLSLKTKRIHNSLSGSISKVLDGDAITSLSSSPQTKTCSVLLNSVPELNEFAKNLSFEKTPVVVLERLSISQYSDENMEIDKTNKLDIKNQAKIKKYSKKGVEDSSVKSQPVRRSSRLTPCRNNKRSLPSSSSSLRNGTKLLTVSANLEVQKESSFNETESPLRVWLKRELESSTNNHVTRSKESTKRIVCATANKDVVISVGCSHMTCDFCYPDSTKLLLGFH